MKILGIETSCDETACAIVEDGRKTLSSVISTQVEEHGIYGGVVPEIASRRHVENIALVCEKTLEKAGLLLSDLDALAVTYAPGLVGSLLVGVNFAKGLSLASGLPLIPVHHIKGHIASNYLANEKLAPPFLSLVVSGGHSHIIEVRGYTDFEVIGRTVDDAAGEAFDKVARTLGLDYPGGVSIDKLARSGDKNAFIFPKPSIEGKPYHFSFSGLKTSVINTVHNAKQKGLEIDKADLSASFEETVAEILVSKTLLVAKNLGYKKIVVAGGVSANTGLRNKFSEEKPQDTEVFFPPLFLCGDNAEMIAAQGYYELLEGNTANLDLNAYPNMSVNENFSG